MKTPEFTIATKKVGAGQFKVIVTDSANDEVQSYIENDMQIIDAMSDEYGMYDITQWEAMETAINKAGFN